MKSYALCGVHYNTILVHLVVTKNISLVELALVFVKANPRSMEYKEYKLGYARFFFLSVGKLVYISTPTNAIVSIATML